MQERFKEREEEEMIGKIENNTKISHLALEIHVKFTLHKFQEEACYFLQENNNFY